MKKITIVGAGRVGESTAHDIAEAELCREIVLIDVVDGIPQGAALDIQQSGPQFGFDTKLTGSTDLKDMKDSELVIITAGIPRKPGMSRSDVLDTNLGILNNIVDEMIKVAPDAMLIVVSNPVDILTYAAWKRTGWARKRVLGMAGVLDSSRMATFIAMETGYSVKDISAMVLGGHGDTMVPMMRFTCINGIPVDQFLSPKEIEDIVERTRGGGAEILNLKRTGSAYDAPAAAIATMVGAISHNHKRILPCVAPLDGEYGESDICMGVPVVLGEHGMEAVIELSLNDSESKEFSRTIAAIRADIERIKQ